MAQQRRRAQQMKKQQRVITALCIAGGIGAVLLSLTVCLLVFRPFSSNAPVSSPIATPMPFDASEPFTLSDLTSSQINQLLKTGRMTVSDGPRGVSVGDTLEKLIARLPSSTGQTAQASQTVHLPGASSDEELLLYCNQYLNKQNSDALTGLQSDEEMILYCADYFENQNGVMTALPPRGLINVNNGQIVVTLLAPTSAYPIGTLDNYRAFEHVYCVYTIDPETMTISSIVLGIAK